MKNNYSWYHRGTKRLMYVIRIRNAFLFQFNSVAAVVSRSLAVCFSIDIWTL